MTNSMREQQIKLDVRCSFVQKIHNLDFFPIEKNN